jgi:hypothetical protein
MRPWPIVTIFRNAMYKELSGTIPKDYWELQPKPAANGKPRQFTPIDLKPIQLAPEGLSRRRPELLACLFVRGDAHGRRRL